MLTCNQLAQHALANPPAAAAPAARLPTTATATAKSPTGRPTATSANPLPRLTPLLPHPTSPTRLARRTSLEHATTTTPLNVMNAGGVDRAEALLRMERRTDVISTAITCYETNDTNGLDLGKLDRGVMLFLLLFD